MTATKAENEAQDALVTSLSFILVVVCLLSLCASLYQSKKKGHKDKDNNNTTKIITDVLTVSSIVCFFVYSVILFTLNTSIWVFGRCKVEYNRMWARVGIPMWFFGKYFMCVYE